MEELQRLAFKAKTGDKKALEELCKSSDIRRIIYKAIYDVHNRSNYRDYSISEDDIYQETLLKIVDKIKYFVGRRTKITSWAYRIAHNITYDVINKAVRKVKGTKKFMIQTKTLGEKENFNLYLKLEDALSKIPREYKRVLRLYYHDKWNFREIAKSMKKSETTARNYHNNGIKLLRKALIRELI